MRLGSLEKKIIQESYRLSCYRTLELRLALAPVLPILEPSDQEMSGKKNRNTALKWRQQLNKRIWSQGAEGSISAKTYDNILAPAPITTVTGSWFNMVEPAHLCYSPGWIVAVRQQADHSRRGIKAYRYKVRYRESSGERLKLVVKKNYTDQKISEYNDSLRKKIALKNNVPDRGIPLCEVAIQGNPDAGIFIGKRCTNPPKSFLNAIAVHAVPIQYRQKESNKWILILLDRPTCYVKLKYFDNFSSKDLVSEIKAFRDRLLKKAWIDIDSRPLRFVTDKSGHKSTALYLTKEEMSDLLAQNDIPTDGLDFDPPVTFKKEEVLAAGDLKKIKKLQERLVEYQNRFNLGFKREYTRPLNSIYENYTIKWEESGRDKKDIPPKAKIKYGLRAWSKPRKYELNFRTVSNK